MSKEKILTIDDLPMHKDTYFFGYGIDIDKPYEMANQIIKLKKENQELKKQLEDHNLAIENLAYWKGKNENKMKINRLRRENKELKILNKRYKEIITDNKENYELFSSEIKNLKTQQKEFIEWLQANLEGFKLCDKNFFLTNYKKEIKSYEVILQKYKEIVGVKDE